MAKKRAAKKMAAAGDESFEDALAGLEGVVADLEGGELPLEESLERYEQGVARLKHCHALLKEAQQRVELLSGVDAEGNPIASPFDESEEESLSEKRSARSGKRSAPKRPKPRGGVDDKSRLF